MCALCAIALPATTASAQKSGPGERAAVGTQLRPLAVGYPRHAVGAWATKISDGSFDVATGRTINWSAHDTDASLAAALSSKRVDIALIGAGVAALAAARGLDLKVFLVVRGQADSESLLTSAKVDFKPGDIRGLQGKVIAVPFGSTPNFRLFESVRRWGGSLAAIHIVNLQPKQLGQAWAHGEVDAVVGSESLLGRFEPQGQSVPLVIGGEHSTLLVFVAMGDFVQQHNVFLSRFVDVVFRADREHSNLKGSPIEDTAGLQPLSLMTGLAPSDVALAIGQYRPPPIEEQASSKWLGGGASAGLLAHFKEALGVWRWAGRVSTADTDLSKAIASGPAQMALGYRR